ncbi:hypothetical protein PO250_02035 [Limosilactobacillus mucosae]|uniref:Uncharacterized protein n=1 Tax=Limosilactobacillus mucosae TaxID=97478 RepID=A0AAJ1HTL6_LIMMU|nr:hypothetical protein [Limosilactobacillus mucosae]MDC2829116.1 hypothetical protein [Limosilactobacillus mucosae]
MAKVNYSEVQNRVLHLSDLMDDFVDAVEQDMREKNMTNTQCILSIYMLGNYLNNIDSESSSPLVIDIAKDLKGLQIYYHIELLRSFISRYYGTRFDTTETAPISAASLGFKDLLMRESQNFLNITKLVPSPLEIIYLCVGSILSQLQHGASELTQAEVENGRQVISSAKEQKRALLDYLEAFEKAYGDQLKTDGSVQ